MKKNLFALVALAILIPALPALAVAAEPVREPVAAEGEGEEILPQPVCLMPRLVPPPSYTTQVVYVDAFQNSSPVWCCLRNYWHYGFVLNYLRTTTVTTRRISSVVDVDTYRDSWRSFTGWVNTRVLCSGPMPVEQASEATARATGVQMAIE